MSSIIDDDQLLDDELKGWAEAEASLSGDLLSPNPVSLRKFLELKLDYTDSEAKPPFTPRQLIAAALIHDSENGGKAIPERV